MIDDQRKIFILPERIFSGLNRTEEEREIIKSLSEKRVIQIFGFPGVGKSEILYRITNYFGDRNIFKDGILYVDFKGVRTSQEATHILNIWLKSAFKDED